MDIHLDTCIIFFFSPPSWADATPVTWFCLDLYFCISRWSMSMYCVCTNLLYPATET